MPQFMRHMIDPSILMVELLLSVVVVIIGLLIFLRIREFYKLTDHNGLKYLKNAFLFFTIGYIIRFLIRAELTSRIVSNLRPAFGMFFIGMVLIGFIGTLAVLYLALSSSTKFFNINEWVVYGSAFLIGLCIIIFRSNFVFFLSQLVIFLIAIGLEFYNYFKLRKKKKFGMHLIYVMLFIAWLTEMFVIGTPHQMLHNNTIVFYVLTIGVLSYILYKVNKWRK